MAIEIHGRDTSKDYRISDTIEKSALDLRIYSNDCKAKDTDWAVAMQQKVILDIGDGSKGKGKRKGKGKGKVGNKHFHYVLKDTVHDNSCPTFCRLARFGDVQRMSGLIYEEC